jgi:hypothetical protein
MSTNDAPTNTNEDEWDDDRDPDRDECDHENADVDILTGRMLCFSCGYSKWLTGDEIAREAELQAEMMEAYYRECEQTEQDAKAAT